MCYNERDGVIIREGGGSVLNKTEYDRLPKRLKEFAVHKKAVQGCSEKTVAEYLLDLRIFLKYMLLKKNGSEITEDAVQECDISGIDDKFYDGVTASDIYEYLYYLSTDRNDSATTRARKLSAVKSFYKFLIVKIRCVENNPCVNIETPKIRKKLPKHLSMGESVNLLETVDHDTDSKNRERDYAIITLFLNCGMRLSELAGISINDIDDEFRSVRVLGKGNKERIVYLNDACRSAISSYMEKRKNMKINNYEYALFLSNRGQRISVKTIQYIVNKYLRAAGLGNKGYSVHKLRHTAATLMYQTGQVDIRVLKDILGHEQLNTTQIYTHVSDKGMEQAINNNPLAEIKADNRKEGKNE